MGEAAGGIDTAPDPPPAPKELSAQEIDGLIENAFGKDCADLKRPILVWVPDFGMVISLCSKFNWQSNMM